MNSQDSRILHFGAIFLRILLFVSAIALPILAIYELPKVRAQAEFLPVEARITELRVSHTPKRFLRDEKVELIASLEYTVNGATFPASMPIDAVAAKRGLIDSDSAIAGMTGRHKVGETRVLFYNPKDPKEWVPERAEAFLITALVSGFFFIVAGIYSKQILRAFGV